MTRTKKLLIGMTSLALAASAGAQTVFSGNFATPTTNINDIGYFVAGNFGSGANLNVSGGNLNVVYGSSSQGLAHIVGHFPSQSISVGESISLDFNVSTATGGLNGVQRGFRFSLGYVAPDNQLTANTPLLRSPIQPDGFTGYGAAISTASGSLTSISYILNTGNAIHKEGLASNGNDAGSLTWLADSTTQNLSTTFTDLTGNLLITRTEEGYDVSVSIGDVSLTTSHTNATPLNFNTFGFGMNGGQPDGGGLQFSSMEVTVIPEPSTAAALAGLLVLGLIAWKRRRR